MKRIICILISVCCLLCFCSCSDSDSNARRSIRLIMDSMPDNTDPQLAESDEALMIVRNCFEGLFRYDSGKAEKAVCDSYDLSDDRLTWTFKLGNSNWSDGQPVTAQDFVFGITRAVLPETVSKDAGMLFCIKGAEDVYGGLTDASALGVEAPDQKTVVIHLVQATDNLPEILCKAMCMPCRKDIFEKGAGRYGMESKLTVCNGPYYLYTVGDTSVRLKENEHYSGKFAPNFTQITVSYGMPDSERISNVSEGIADIASVSAVLSDDIKEAGLKQVLFNDTAWAIFINPAAGTLGEPSVSKAIKSALDVGAYKDALPSGFSPFGGIIADHLHIGGGSYHDLTGDRPAMSGNANASDDLVAALKSHKGKLSAITMIYPDGYELKQAVTHIAQYWQQQLGIVVNIQSESVKKVRTDISSGNYQIALSPVISDDGFAVTALSDFSEQGTFSAFSYAVKNIGIYSDSESIMYAEKQLTDNEHIIPVAQSGRCFAASDQQDGVKFDLFQGMISFYE